MAYNDVLAAAMYWQDRHLLKIESDSFVFYDNYDAKEDTKAKKYIINDHQPQYQPEELEIYREKNPDVRFLFDMAQGKIGRMLSYNDMSVILSLYHWLGLKLEVISILLDFCVQNGHRNMRYIETVAIDWCESNINDETSAKERINKYNTVYANIMRYMGIGGKEPIDKQIHYMEKWVNDYKMPDELIKLACEKSVISTGKAAFGYADSILKAWYNSGFKTIKEVEQSEKVFAENKKKAAEAKKNNESYSKPKNNRFLNYEQTEYDYDALERMAIERLNTEGN